VIELPFIRHYYFAALHAGAELMERALEGITADEIDVRPDPDRFTLREIVAHLADWEELFLQRMIRTVNEDQPYIDGIDEGLRAQDQHYAATDIAEQTALFLARRHTTIDYLQILAPEDWQRTCIRTDYGPVTLEAQAMLLTLHDNYHLLQLQQWRRPG
jgi:hypothetical protein